MIFVFKTNVANKKSIKNVEPVLNGLPYIQKWNFDLKDSDKILRIDTQHDVSMSIPVIITGLGFECTELT